MNGTGQDSDLVILAAKVLGACGGVILAFAFQPPISPRDLFTRGTFSLLSGILFGQPVREQWLHWSPELHNRIAVASLVALASWPIYGAVIGTALRMIRAWKAKD